MGAHAGDGPGRTLASPGRDRRTASTIPRVKLALLLLTALSLTPATPATPARGAQSAPAGDETEAPLTPEQFTAVLRKRFETHKHLSKVLFVEDATYDPVRLFLHKPQVETPDWQKKVALAHGPFLARIWESFRKRYVEPLKLQRRPDVPLFAVCILQTAGDHLNYLAAARSASVFRAAAAFERRSRFTVAFHDGAPALPLRRRDELAEFVAALLQAHYSGPGGEPAQLWLAPGLGWYLASCGSSDPATLDNPSVDSLELQLAGELAGDATQRWIHLQRLPDIVEATSWNAVWDRSSERARAAGLQVDSSTFHRFWFRQCALWMHFLQEDPARRQRFLSYLGYALQGRGNFEAFRKAFDGVDLDALERDFYRWVLRTQLARRPQDKLDLAIVDTLFDAPPAVKAKAAAAGEAAPNAAAPVAETVAPAPEPFDPRSLAPSRDDFTAEHGLVLQRIRRGDLDGARTQLEALAARAAGSEIERRLGRELERLKRFVAIRDAWLAGLVASGTKRSFDLGGRKVVAKLERIENGRIRLGENRQGLESIGLDEFTPAQIARELPKELLDLPDGWIRNYAYVLDADERWKRGLAAGSPESEQARSDLRTDAEEWYPGVLKLGLAAQQLVELSESGVPADASSGAACLERIDAVRSDFAALELVRGRSEPLKELARLALERTFSVESFVSALPGKYDLDDIAGAGRVRLTLDFSDAAQLGAFEQVPTFFLEWRSRMEIERSTPEVSVEDGALRMVGPAACKLRLGLGAPLRVEVTAIQRSTSGYSLLEVFALFENEDNFVACAPERLLVRDERSSSECVQGKYTVPTERPYRLAFAVGADEAFAFCDDRKVAQCPSKGRTKGDLVLYAHSDAPIVVDKFVIEGQLDLDHARAAWIDAELARRGF